MSYEVDPRWKGAPKRKSKVSRDASELRAIRRALLERSRGRCEAAFVLGCTGYGTEIHHVKRRSQGGDNSLTNTRFVCRACHVAAHNFPESAREFGLLAPKGSA